MDITHLAFCQAHVLGGLNSQQFRVYLSSASRPQKLRFVHAWVEKPAPAQNTFSIKPMATADASIDADILQHEVFEDANDVLGKPTSDMEFIESSAHTAVRDTDPHLTTMQFDLSPAPSHRDPSIPFSALGDVLRPKAVKRNGLAVVVPPARNRWEFKVFEEEEEVDEILEEYDDAGFIEYLVLFSDDSEDVVSIF